VEILPLVKYDREELGLCALTGSAGSLEAPAHWERRLSSRPRLMRARCPHQAIVRPERLGTFPSACSARMDLVRV
jgi:hypothetical protein